MMAYFHYIRFRFRQASIKADDITVTPSDYTLRIKDIPPETSSDDLKEWIKGLGNEANPIDIRKINRAYQILDYLDIKAKLPTLEAKINKANEKRKPALEKQKEALNESLKKYKTEKDFKFTKTSFVTFKTAAQADYIKKLFTKSLLRHIADFLTSFLYVKTRFKGTRIVVTRAPEPTDIVWQNLCYADSTILKWRVFTAFMTLFLIGASFGLIIGINKLQVFWYEIIKI
jgi:Cytosolic domain of 10TM putative phosphate transporter